MSATQLAEPSEAKISEGQKREVENRSLQAENCKKQEFRGDVKPVPLSQ